MKEYTNKAYSDVNLRGGGIRVSIITAVYNSVDTIDRCINSVKRQTYKNIEHIIIDDGSTDDLDAKIFSYMEKADYPVIYVKKTNGGKHTAINIGWSLVRGEYTTGIDSDDELTETAIEDMLKLWDSIPSDIYDRYWCVLCRCKNPETGDLCGKPFSEDINDITKTKKQKMSAMAGVGGEMLGLRKSSVVTKYRFPEEKNINFIVEGYVWGQINKIYDTYCSNKVVRLYYTNASVSLSRPKFSKQTISNKFYNSCIILNTKKERYMTLKRYIRNYIIYSTYINLLDKDFLKEHNCSLKYFSNRAIVCALSIPGKILAVILRHRNNF